MTQGFILLNFAWVHRKKNFRRKLFHLMLPKNIRKMERICLFKKHTDKRIVCNVMVFENVIYSKNSHNIIQHLILKWHNKRILCVLNIVMASFIYFMKKLCHIFHNLSHKSCRAKHGELTNFGRKTPKL